MRQLLLNDGVIGETAVLTALSGGVSSEIYLVRDGAEEFVVKRALPKLKVQQEWFADTVRNANEAAYIGYVSRFCPNNVPQVRHVNREHGYFCMEYLGSSLRNWKQMMLDGIFDPEIAARAGRLLGTIHARSANDAHAREQFQTLANFEKLRIEPYLLTAARRHPALKEILEAEAMRLRAQRNVLTHGDFSPKNILVNSDRLVLIDCEVAWYGDAAFDVAFLLCHLFLKLMARPAMRPTWRSMIDSAWSAYRQSAAPHGDLEATVAHLLLMLMLARVDGKSPVEYLDGSQQEDVRRFVIPRLQHGPAGLSDLAGEWLAI